MRVKKRYVIPLFLALVLALAGAFWVGEFRGQQRQEPEISNQLVGNRLEQAQELTTTKYFYTNTGSFKNSKQFNGWQLPFTTKTFILSYDGIIHAGIDLSEVKIHVGKDTIQLKLPKAKILSHEIDDDSMQILDEGQTVLNPSKVEDYTRFTQEQKKVIEEKALANGLLEETDKKAKEAIVSLLNMDPYIQKNYKITFK